MPQPTLQSHRHCMVVHNYYPLEEPRVERQTKALVEVGAEVDIICLRRSGDPPRECDGAIRIFRLPIDKEKEHGAIGHLLEYLAFFVLAFIQLSKNHLQYRYQVVQVHNLPDFLVFVALLPRLTGAAVILDLHDLMPEFYASRFKSDLNSFPVRLVRWQEWLSCRFASHVITVTELWRQTLIQRGIPSAKCSVVMNIADNRIFKHPSSGHLVSRNGPLHLIYHGTLTHRYGIDLILRAVAQARNKAPEIRLTIHGRGEYLFELKQLANELNLQDSVYFSTELLPIEELPRLLASADVGLVPYRRDVFTDGILPTKLMEYAALSLPAIVVRTPVIETYFTENMVEFCEAEDVDSLCTAIIRLNYDADRRTALANNIVTFSCNHNWASQRANYLSQVASLVSRNILHN